MLWEMAGAKRKYMQYHELKTLNPFFQAVWERKKNFDVRKNDRDFQVGDRVKLIEQNPIGQARFIILDITYILEGGQFGIDKDYVVLGLLEFRP
jgi:ribosomal protein S17